MFGGVCAKDIKEKINCRARQPEFYDLVFDMSIADAKTTLINKGRVAVHTHGRFDGSHRQWAVHHW